MSRACYLTLTLTLLTGLFACLLAAPASAESYCSITEVSHEAVSNAVQVTVKSDGILKWDWEGSGDYDDDSRQVIAVRFPNARLKLDNNFVDVDKAPLSSILLYTPQDATDGTGIVMEVSLSESSHFKGVGSTDERSFVLTIDAPLRSDEAAKGPDAKKATGTEEFISVTCSGGLVTLRALRADIHKVVAEVAHQAGLNITVDDAVAHKVNINLRDLAPLDVIRAIAAGYGLALSTNGDVHMLSEGVPKDLTTYNRSGTSSFPMRYLRAEDAKELLPSFLTKYVHFNAEQNAVVATAPDQMLEKIQRDLKSVDLPPPLIMVDVLAVEISSDGSFERDFSWLYRTHDKLFGTNSLTGAATYVGAGPGDMTGGVIANSAQLKATLRALEGSGNAKIRSSPRIAAVNGKEASIFIGQDRFILVTYQAGGVMQERIETVPVGVSLGIQPWTGGNGEITTSIQVEVSNISSIDSTTGLPLLSSRKAGSTVRTLDGETIVIGGLRQKQKEVVDRKIPFLGDIPIIGQLFRGKSESSVDTELVIFVTPRLLPPEKATDGLLGDADSQHLLEPGDLGYQAPAPAAPQ
jgi:type II secretory pathway component GspD/PulD (secretin)